MQKAVRPYGLWSSPVTPGLLADALRLSDVQWDSDGETLVWLEGRSDQGVLVAREDNQALHDLTYDNSVHAGVGYGGGDFTVSQGVVVFAQQNGRLYRRRLGYDQPHAITPPFGYAAAPQLSPDGNWVLFVHTAERKDSLGLVRTDGETWPTRLVYGADFYMQPVWHPSGKRIAWVEWDHPHMPWDGTRLKLAYLAGENMTLAHQELIDGGADTPIFQPEFSPDGHWLSYLLEDGETTHLELLDLRSGERRTVVNRPGLIEPAWVQGMRTYAWRSDSQGLYYLINQAGFSSLWRVGLQSGKSTVVDLGAYTWLRQISVSRSQVGQIALIASSPSIPDRIITWNGHAVRVERRRDPEAIGPDDLPQVQPISWKSPNGTEVYGLYAPPASSRYRGEGLPPAILYIHGGPTSQVTAGYSGDRAFFTGRGYAWLDVNYRGSSGYGRSYMLALRGQWGLLDTEDAAEGANALISRDLADPKRLVIKGGSAGGYTVLNALIHYPGKFKAGLCSFGVSNLFTMASDTHKFEEHYLDSLVGPLPEAATRYQDWSPIFHADHIQDSLAVFQGSIDAVVPPDQSESIVDVLKANKIPHIYRLYPGEGHGFKRNDTIAAYYQDIDRFLKQHVLFSA
ncbi:MAG: prolyl oligopeptidase family serine peptidase [Anaerolineaceae bacterium]|nr:prolyl oligopeptidase family serine peptidase [Anaerolineaceae bacterium]